MSMALPSLPKQDERIGQAKFVEYVVLRYIVHLFAEVRGKAGKVRKIENRFERKKRRRGIG
jgi:hypothetical protein